MTWKLHFWGKRVDLTEKCPNECFRSDALNKFYKKRNLIHIMNQWISSLILIGPSKLYILGPFFDLPLGDRPSFSMPYHCVKTFQKKEKVRKLSLNCSLLRDMPYVIFPIELGRFWSLLLYSIIKNFNRLLLREVSMMFIILAHMISIWCIILMECKVLLRFIQFKLIFWCFIAWLIFSDASNPLECFLTLKFWNQILCHPMYLFDSTNPLLVFSV